MKKRSEETQTLHTGCSEAEPKIFAPPQTRFPGAQDGQNSICWKWSLPLPTNPVWRGSMHAISSYGSNRHTNTHTPTDRTGYNTLCCSFTSAQCNHTSRHNYNVSLLLLCVHIRLCVHLCTLSMDTYYRCKNFSKLANMQLLCPRHHRAEALSDAFV